MKMSVRMTLDGLIRALRWRAHDLAEQVEQDYRAGMPGAGENRRIAGDQTRGKREGNDRSGR